jgi:hypothetical protein
MPKQTKAEKLADKRIERAYGAKCSGVQIDIMDIGKVFKVGQGFLANYPDATDQQLADRIAAFVETIRKN